MTCWSISSLEQKNTRLFSLCKTFTNIDILDDSASPWSIGSLEQRITRLFSLGEIWPTFCSFGFALIGALVRSVCDDVCSAFKDTFGLTLIHSNC